MSHAIVAENDIKCRITAALKANGGKMQYAEPRTLALLEASGMVTVGHLLNAYYEERLRSIEGIGVRRAGEVYFEVVVPIQERSRWIAMNRKSRKKS